MPSKLNRTPPRGLPNATDTPAAAAAASTCLLKAELADSEKAGI
jgi:hypothetical protein